MIKFVDFFSNCDFVSDTVNTEYLLCSEYTYINIFKLKISKPRKLKMNLNIKMRTLIRFVFLIF